MILRKQQGILLILPALVVMGVFTFYPLLEGIRIAFTNKHLLKEGVEFVGLQNFARLASDEIFWTSLIQSIILTAVVVFLQFVFGLILAWAMSQELPGMSWFKSIIMASWVIPVAATVILFKFMAQPDVGLINIIIKGLGFESLLAGRSECCLTVYHAAAFMEKCSFLRHRLSGCHAGHSRDLLRSR